ncbi:MAG: VWA domain-containing protein [Spirochaetes bacterium]|nr:MAG: VWA domain-containing protein [Spirochaetota bacterium]
MRQRVSTLIAVTVLAIAVGCSSLGGGGKAPKGGESDDRGKKIEGASGMIDESLGSDTDRTGKTEKSEPKAARPSDGEKHAEEPTTGLRDDKAAKTTKADGFRKDESKPKEPSGMTDTVRPKESAPTTSGLKAGFADDNKQFNYFVNFLNKYAGEVSKYPLNIQERIIFRVKDSAGKPVANAHVEIYGNRDKLCWGKTYADGTYLFFPSEYDQKYIAYKVQVTSSAGKKEIAVDRQGKREIPIALDAPRTAQKNVPLDIVFVMDTTGSMGEEIARLKDTIEIIKLNLTALPAKPAVRFGMVLYKDKDEEEYRTQVIPLTDNMDAFKRELDKVEASGGGDEPEDLQGALADLIGKIKWNPDGIRISLIITDAPPHLDYGQEYTYAGAARDARAAGIKIFTVGTGGLPLMGEYILRQISQYTYAKYIFLTYGEKGESAGGKEGSVSHHTGSNFTTDKLETIIMRFAKEELSYVSDQPIDMGEEFFQAKKLEDEKNEETLRKLFDMSILQLVDYSSLNLEQGTPTSIAPFAAVSDALAVNAEYFTEQMGHSLQGNKLFKVVERKDMQKILKELELQQTGLIDDEGAAKIGKMLGAKLIISGKLYARTDTYELFIKLLRVETAEILAVNKLKIDKNLGLAK